jgi:hypothetical protein
MRISLNKEYCGTVESADMQAEQAFIERVWKEKYKTIPS